MIDKRMDVTFLARLLGTASGWDGEDGSYLFYDFIPAEGVNLPACTSFQINEQDGNFLILDQDTQVLETFDIVSFLYQLPKVGR